MSDRRTTGVRDGRRQPFSWVTNDSLRAIRDGLPVTRQAGARNALLALAEAASQRRDGHHREGDPLVRLTALAGVSERRLRDHLKELEALGLVRVEAPRDPVGRDLAKVYVLADAPGSDESSDRGVELSDRSDETADESSVDPSDPTRACEGDKKQENEEVGPDVGGRVATRVGAGAGRAVSSSSFEDERHRLAEQIRGLLQRGIDGLTSNESAKRPTREAILAALVEHDPRLDVAMRVAIEVRSVAQAQNRAPNIAALYRQKLAAATVRREAA